MIRFLARLAAVAMIAYVAASLFIAATGFAHSLAS